MYYSNYLVAFYFNVYTESTSYNFSFYPFLNLVKTPLKASLGRFFALTVLIKSGKSRLLSFFTK